MHRFAKSTCAAACLAVISGIAMADGPAVVGTVSITPTDDIYEITATVEGATSQLMSVKAKLVIVKSDRSGSMETRQSKSVEVRKGSRLQVAQTGISLGREGTLVIKLIIEENGNVVDRVIHTVSRDQVE